MVAQVENDSQPRFLLLDLDSGNIDRIADGKNIAVTPSAGRPMGNSWSISQESRTMAGQERF